jgi:citrate synthase
VSRGLVRSEPTGEGTRGRRYRAEDVRSLKNRRAPLVEGQGLKSADLPVMDSPSPPSRKTAPSIAA